MEAQNLLWTSGWDSTFRLLYLIFIEKKTVQPIYIVDESRRSLNKELQAIDCILKIIEKKHPNATKLVLPFIKFDKKEISVKQSIAENFAFLKSKTKIGGQYEWLSLFCEQNNLKKVELCIEKDAITSSFFNFIYPYIHSQKEDNEYSPEELKLKNAVFTVFNYFEFPLFETNKIEMYEIAKENNWLEIMELTWFCHTPKKGIPCGKCNPCQTTIMKGLGFRVPFKNRMKGYIKIYKKKVKLMLR